MNKNDPLHIPDEKEERLLINSGVGVGPIETFKETAKERRLRLFLANEDAIEQASAAPISLEDRIRTIIRQELASLFEPGASKPKAKKKK